MQDNLTKAFDKDGDGFIDCQELLEAANLYTQTKATNSLLRKGMVFVACLSVGLVATLAGLTYGIVDANKDTQIEGRALMTKAEEPVSVGTNEMKLSIATLPFLPSEISSKVNDISFASDDTTMKVLHRKILAIDIIPDESLKLETTAGDIITWSIDNTDDVSIVLQDGTSWTKDASCMKCTSTNVFPSSDVLKGVKNFEEATGLTERHLQASDPARVPSKSPTSICVETRSPVATRPTFSPTRSPVGLVATGDLERGGRER